MSKKLQAVNEGGASNRLPRRGGVTGNLGVETKKERQSTSARKRKSSNSTRPSTASTLPAKLISDPSILLAQFNDILQAMSKAGWFVNIGNRSLDMIAASIRPPEPHVIEVTGTLTKPVITLDSEQI